MKGSSAGLRNVLLVVAGGLRSDVTEPGVWPAISSLAGHGVVVAGARTTSTDSRSAVASLLSGRLPRSLGIGGGVPTSRALGAHRRLMLPAVLHDRGFATGAVLAHPFVSAAEGFGIGFDIAHELSVPRRSAGPGRIEQARWMARAGWGAGDAGVRAAEALVGHAVRERRDRWFWMVHLVDCLPPFLPPRWATRTGPMERLRLARDLLRHGTVGGSADVTGGLVELPGDVASRFSEAYRDCVRAVDDFVGRLVDLLESASLLDDTLVVLTGDHGEHLGEDGRLGHLLTMGEAVLRVPLVVSGAGVPDDTRSVADIPRLVARALSLDDHPWRSPIVDDGVAIATYDSAGWFTGSQRVGAAARPGEVVLARLHEPMASAFDGRFKLVIAGGREQLVDVVGDPAELVDVAADHPDAVERLRAALRRAADQAVTADMLGGSSGPPADLPRRSALALAPV